MVYDELIHIILQDIKQLDLSYRVVNSLPDEANAPKPKDEVQAKVDKQLGDIAPDLSITEFKGQYQGSVGLVTF